MASYGGALPAGPGFVVKTVCFTRATASTMRTALSAAGLFGGAALGLVIGIALSLLTGPEVISKLVAAIVGVIAGGALGLAYVRYVFSLGGCACPPGIDGFCVGFVFWAAPFGPTLPTPPFLVPAPSGSCALIPPGCP
jgi:hypothetical protein